MLLLMLLVINNGANVINYVVGYVISAINNVINVGVSRGYIDHHQGRGQQ